MTAARWLLLASIGCLLVNAGLLEMTRREYRAADTHHQHALKNAAEALDYKHQALRQYLDARAFRDQAQVELAQIGPCQGL